MAEKMTPNGLVIGLIADQKETKKGKGKPSKLKGEESNPTNESSERNDSSEQAEKTEE